MAKDHKEKRKKRLKAIAFAAFLFSLSAAGWFLIALLADLMNPRLLSISFGSSVPPIARSLFMYMFCRYMEKKAEAIVTEREQEREEEKKQRRQDLVTALTRGARLSTTKKPSDT
jgi:hypothetical protein